MNIKRTIGSNLGFIFKSVVSVSVGVITAFGVEGAKNLGEAALVGVRYATQPHTLARDMRELIQKMQEGVKEDIEKNLHNPSLSAAQKEELNNPQL